MYQQPTAPKQPSPIDVHVGGRIRMQRLLHGLSQGALADGLGISFQQVQKYEKGTNRVGASRLQAIADLLNVPVSFFFEDLPGSTSVPEDMNDEKRQVLEFVSSHEGIALNKAFNQVRDETLRRKIIGLAKALAGEA